MQRMIPLFPMDPEISKDIAQLLNMPVFQITWYMSIFILSNPNPARSRAAPQAPAYIPIKMSVDILGKTWKPSSWNDELTEKVEIGQAWEPHSLPSSEWSKMLSMNEL